MVNNNMSFPGPLGSKRRRMRSGGGVSTLTNNGPKALQEENISEQKTTQTSKCKGATTIPIFLKKTYKLIDTCDSNIASWTADGEMFVVKDPDTFAREVIPQYFDHNKFSSFARQLNFYGFRKMQSKPIRNSDYDAASAKHVTFYNENFKKGRCDLLKKIQRSTRGGGNNNSDQAKEITALREQVSKLEQKLTDLAAQTEERVRRLELDMLGRMEQMMIAVQQQQQQQQQRPSIRLEKMSSIGTMNSIVPGMKPAEVIPNAWDNAIQRGLSISTVNSVNENGEFPLPAATDATKQAPPPTLPPHPKQKQLPAGTMPGATGAPPDRMNSLRGISQFTGLSGLSRGASVDSSASAVVMRNSWEDKFFSMLMLDGENGKNPNAANGAANGTVGQTPATGTGVDPVTVSEGSGRATTKAADDDMSDVSDTA